MTKNDDKLYSEVFGEEEPAPAPAPAAAQPAPKPKAAVVAAPPAPAPTERETAQLFAEMMVENRRAASLPKAHPAAPAHEVPDAVHPLAQPHEHAAAAAEIPAESITAWTVVRGTAVIAMLIYLVGFGNTRLADGWVTLLALTAALGAGVLLADYLRGAWQRKA